MSLVFWSGAFPRKAQKIYLFEKTLRRFFKKQFVLKIYFYPTNFMIVY